MRKLFSDHKWQISFLSLWLILVLLSLVRIANNISFSVSLPGQLMNPLYFVVFYSSIVVTIGYLLMRWRKTGNLVFWSRLAQGLVVALLIIILLNLSFSYSYPPRPVITHPDSYSQTLIPVTPVQYALYEPPPFPGTFSSDVTDILLAIKNADINQSLTLYRLSAASGRIMFQKTIRLADDMGESGCSSFMGTYSVCKHAVWFSSDGQKAVIQTERQSDPLSDPPYFIAWYLLDVSIGSLSRLYRVDVDQQNFTLVEWLYDGDKNVYIQTKIDPSNPLVAHYYLMDIEQRSIFEIPSAQYPDPDDLFQDYSYYFDLSEHQYLRYVRDRESIITPLKLSHISDILGVHVLYQSGDN